MSDGESDGAAPHAAGDEEAAIEATEDWVVERCGVEDITAWTQLALPGYTTAYPKLRGLGTALISFAGLTSLDVSRNCLTSFDGLASLSQLQRLNYYFNAVASLSDLTRLRANRQLSHLDCRLNPVARNHSDYRMHVLHLLPQLQRLDERDVRPAERRQASAFAPSAHAPPSLASGSERSSWNSLDVSREQESASLQRAARALLQQDEDDEDESSNSDSDGGPRGAGRSDRTWTDTSEERQRSAERRGPRRRRGGGGRSGGGGQQQEARRWREEPRRPSRAEHHDSPDLHDLQPLGGTPAPDDDDDDSEGFGMGSVPRAVAGALAKCEAEARRRQAAESELDAVRAQMRGGAEEVARLRRELSEATAGAARETAQRESETAEGVRWKQRAEAAEARLAALEQNATTAAARSEATTLEVRPDPSSISAFGIAVCARLATPVFAQADDEECWVCPQVERLQQQLATAQQLHDTMSEERTEMVAQGEAARSTIQREAKQALEREQRAVAESKALRKEINVAERYLEVR